MKTRSIIFAFVWTMTAIALLASCSGNKKEEAATESHEDHEREDHEHDATAPAESSKPQFEVDNTFQQQLAGVFNAYVSLKDAFVASDPAQVKKEAARVRESITKTDMKLLSGAAHNDWMTHLAGLEASLKDIQATDDIEAQRKAFSTLSDNLYKSIKAFGLGGATAYYEFCPMAFNDEGGYWLSNEEKIRNPYFGDKMLTCGSVQEKLQ